MASKVGYDVIGSDQQELVPDTQDPSLNEEAINLEDELLLVYSEAGPATLDIPQALLEGVTYDTPVQYRDLVSHGDDEEERGENAHVVTALALHIDIDKCDEEMQDILKIVQDFSRSRLWQFHAIPIAPPESQLKERLFPDTSAEDIQPFIAPDPNELRRLAIGPDGSPRRLTADQLRGVREEGSFEVPSQNFPGAVHVWRISQLLQRGRHLANDDLKSLLSVAYGISFILARDRIIGDEFSIKDVIKHFGYSIYFVYNLLIGAQARTPRVSRKEELMKSLTADLKTDHKVALPKSKRDKLVNASYKQSGVFLNASQVSNVYTNGEGVNMNIFAVSSCWIKSLKTKIMSEIYSKAKDSIREKFPPQLVKQLIAEYQGKGMSNEEVKRVIQNQFDVEFVTHLINSIKEHPDINTVIPLGQGRVIDSYFRGLNAVHEAIEEETKRVEEVVKERKEHLTKHCSVRSKCNPWFDEQISKARNSAFVRENSFENIRQKLQTYSDIGPEWEYFINICESHYRNLPQTIRRVQKKDYEFGKFTFERYIWNPKNYIVTNTLGERKRNLKIQPKGSYGTNYTIQYEEEYLVTTRYPGWRWRVFFVSIYTWLLNLLFIFLFYFILKGPFSLSGLFLWYDHPIEYSADGETGNLYPSKRGQTLKTRLVSLWRTILDRRREFESRPDTGFLPKNVTRFMNRLYYFVIWGFLGSIILIIGFICISIFSINLGLILIATLPIWFTAYQVMKVVVRWYFYDWQHRFKERFDGIEHGYIMPLFYVVFYKLLTRVCLQFVVLLFVLLALPLASIVIILFAFVRRIVRLLWDFIMFHLVIRLRGRVPETDSFLARRVSGPGLATNYFYRIDPNQALIKFEYDLECKEVDLYEEFMRSLIDQPRMVYSQFIKSILSSFGYSPTQQGESETLRSINAQKTGLLNELRRNLKLRRDSFRLKQPDVAVGSLRMNREDLEITVEVATILIKEFYTKRIIFYPNHSLETIFSAKGLTSGDWESLAKIELTNSFSHNFLTHLEDSDENFNLQVNKFGLNKYFKNLRYGKTAHDLDKERLIIVERGATFLPSISLSPNFDESWALNGCTSSLYNRKFTKFHPGTKTEENLFFPSKFNDKVEIFKEVADRVGWDSFIEEIPESSETDQESERILPTSEDEDMMTSLYFGDFRDSD